MAFLKFTVRSMVDVKDQEGTLKSIKFVVEVEDSTPPLHTDPGGGASFPETKTVVLLLSGEKFDAMPLTNPARKNYLAGFLKSEVQKIHAGWIDEIALRSPPPEIRDSAAIAAELGSQEFTSLT